MDGGPGERITAADGLPSDNVTAIASLDGKLYAGLNEKQSYLISYDLATRQVRVLSSSLRRDHQSPLDDGPPFLIQHMRSDARRHRVLFTITETPGQGGLWQIDTRTQQVRRLLEYSEIGGWVSPILDDHLLMHLYNHRCLLSFDLNTDTARALYVETHSSHAPEWAASAHTITLSFGCRPPFLIRKGWLWTASPFSRISPDGGKQELFPEVKGLTRSPQWRCMVEVGNGEQLLAGTFDSLWLLPLERE